MGFLAIPLIPTVSANFAPVDYNLTTVSPNNHIHLDVTSLEQIQGDLDAFMNVYNAERTNQGRNCNGRTPMQTFVEGLELCNKYVHENEKGGMIELA